MSLRARLSILITIVFLLILTAGSGFVIENARRAISDEVHSAARFTVQLIEIALLNTDKTAEHSIEQDILQQVSRLESSRHLQIRILNRSIPGNHLPIMPDQPIHAAAPDWFINLVKPQVIEYRRTITTSDNKVTDIVIRADPSDEISEVWQDSKDVLLMFVLSVVLSILAVYYTLGRDLAPISIILNALDGIERGEYRLRLPQFHLKELSLISEKFNLMAGVLEQTREENRQLTQRSLAIQERERQHLAHELHDELGQSIAAIKAVATSINQSGQDQKSLQDSVSTILDVSNRMYDVARGMMRRLRPAVLDEFGLIRALQDMIDDWNSVHEDVFCQFEFNGDFSSLNEDERISIYRIVQESLTNVIKHSQATNVQIQLDSTGVEPDRENFSYRLRLKIKDNGIGFLPGSIKRGLGFLGMHERVDALSGKLKIDAKPEQGVSISIEIP